MENFPFIDCHLHFHDPRMTKRNIIGIILKEFPLIKSFYDKPEDNSVLLGMMDAINCERAWVINYESKMMGYSIATNDWVSTFCENSSDRLIPIGGINPYFHDNAASILRDYLESGLIKGVQI